jgi:hypothetical protein
MEMSPCPSASPPSPCAQVLPTIQISPPSVKIPISVGTTHCSITRFFILLSFRIAPAPLPAALPTRRPISEDLPFLPLLCPRSGCGLRHHPMVRQRPSPALSGTFRQQCLVAEHSCPSDSGSWPGRRRNTRGCGLDLGLFLWLWMGNCAEVCQRSGLSSCEHWPGYRRRRKRCEGKPALAHV